MGEPRVGAAEDALALAPKYRNHPQYGTAIYLANMTLGTLALRDGDREKAAQFLRRASRAPASEPLAYSDGMVSSFHWHLAADLRYLFRLREVAQTHDADVAQ